VTSQEDLFFFLYSIKAVDTESGRLGKEIAPDRNKYNGISVERYKAENNFKFPSNSIWHKLDFRITAKGAKEYNDKIVLESET
jgi:hypothetical protein